ncbi:PH domain-containing protein [Nonomuraea muscovyensis]|uniref:Putative membrane protein YdbT with pleckstrin-like domain n=1 Tax=Nonomuraea muscovyensis TaxID=1124761 RepID=A0A7X0F2R2_9ACTN|nr:PH domain-containing protein [Nonomuraea muscovyensis]MBB6350706.1 putative membrane protein YdbT with pleckstrin-like domain [Nonomuraea muscovyensis]
MTIPDHHLTEGERRVRSFHPHWRTLAGPFAALVLIAAASGAGLWLVPGTWEYAGYARIAICAVALGLLTVWSFVPYLQWKNTGYVLTTHRFTISTGVLNKSTDEIPMAKLNTVSSDQTLLERLLGCGTLTVESAGERGQLVLRDIPKIQEVRGDLFRLLEDASDDEQDADPASR